MSSMLQVALYVHGNNKVHEAGIAQVAARILERVHGHRDKGSLGMALFAALGVAGRQEAAQSDRHTTRDGEGWIAVEHGGAREEARIWRGGVLVRAAAETNVSSQMLEGRGARDETKPPKPATARCARRG